MTRQNGHRPARVASNEVGFAVVFLVVNLHTFRRFSEVLYLAIYALILIPLVIRYVGLKKSQLLNDHGMTLNLYVAAGLWAFLVSLLTISVYGSVMGLSRFLFAAPVYLALVVFTRSVDELRRHIGVMVIFYSLGAATVPLQEVTGPLGLFADASVRAGLDRYSSLLGSVAVVATTLSTYMVLAQAKPGVKWPWMVLMVVSASVSLSKASIANIVLGVLAILWINRRRVTRVILAISTAGLAVYVAFAGSAELRERLLTTLDAYGFTALGGVRTNSDASVSESALARLSELPLRNLEGLSSLNSPLFYLTGGGFGQGGRALVPEADAFAIQAHNQYVELLTVFGAVAVVVILPIVVLTLVRLIRLRLKTGNDIYEIVAIAYLMLLVSALFANGKFYQPTSASVLFLAMFASTSTVLGGVHPTISSRVSESSGSDSPNLDGARGTPGRHRRGVEKSGAGDR